MPLTAAALLGAWLALLASCGQEERLAPAAGPGGGAAASPGGASVALAPAGNAERGRQVYVTQCLACHNSNPGQDGPLGPAVKGSSPALIEARVLRAAYPPGYRPKRDSTVMPARPDLAASIADLAAFLR